MCTVSIKVNDALLEKARVNLDSDVDIAEWVQQQIEAILIKMALASETSMRQYSKNKSDEEFVNELLALRNESGISAEEMKQVLRASHCFGGRDIKPLYDGE